MISKIYKLFLDSTGINTDTRKIEKDNLFFALKGANFNGNLYAEKALKLGASFAIIDEAQCQKDERYILVDNVLETLQKLSKHHREQFDIPIIAITGTNGKTTTKELMQAVLGTTFKTFATKGNLNNHIGVPLSLLSINSTHEMAIIEMGANHTKEIEAYCNWAQPTHGLIANIGSAHLEGFGSLDGVIQAKTELYTALQGNKGTVFYNIEDDLLEEKSRIISNRKSYGFSSKADFAYEIEKDFPCVAIQKENTTIQSHLFGTYNAINIACALSVGAFFDVTIEAAKKGIEAYFPANNRSQIIEKESRTIILDAYNANPTSMSAAIDSFAKMEGKKIAFLGDMFELGDDSLQEHLNIAQLAASKSITQIVLVGLIFKTIQSKIDCIHFDDSEAAKQWYKSQDFSNYSVLIKGSRSMEMEKIIEQ